MNYFIAIDGGTTNTRAVLWDTHGKFCGISSEPVGVRDTAIDGHNGRLKEGVRACLATLLEKGGISYEQVSGVYAAGMIGSEVGLAEIPHLTAPAAIRDFASSVVRVVLPDVCPLPICFIPGLKNFSGEVNQDNLASMDIMRGEEVETFALLEQCEPGVAYLFVLPGSHSKYVSVSADGAILGCMTSLSGELLEALTKHTILAKAVGGEFVEDWNYCREMVLLGCHTAEEAGFGRAAFSTRILSLFAGTVQDAANFLLGAVLQNDLASLRSARVISTGPDMTVVVAGKDPLRKALTDLLRDEGRFRCVNMLPPPGEAPLSAVGIRLIAKQHRDII